jgi:hypothetical protein
VGGGGRSIGQAVSRRLHNSAAWVLGQVRSCGICGQSGTGVGFLRVHRFPLPIFIYRLLHIHHHLPSGSGTIGQIVADVPSGLILTTPQETKKKNSKGAEAQKSVRTTTVQGYRALHALRQYLEFVR